MEEATTSLRDTIESAFDTTEPAAAPEPAQSVESAPETAPNITDAPQAQAKLDLETLSEEEGAPKRDEQGRFAEKGVQPGPKSGPKPAAAPEKAPASWRPDIREHWQTLPEPVRAEIVRREREVQKTLQDTAEARRMADAVMRTIQPYEGFIKAEGGNPLQAIDNLMATAARLRTAPGPELATLVAQVVKQFGVGRFGNNFIEMLDSALAGEAPRPQDSQQQAVQQVIQQQLAPVQQFMQQFQQAQAAQQQQLAQSAANEVQQFLSQAEFGDDVREDMADILEVAQRRGVQMTLQDAYNKAVMINDRVRKAMDMRQQQRGAMQQTSAAQRAKQAAVSVAGSAPMGALKQDPTDVRSAIEAAIAMSQR